MKKIILAIFFFSFSILLLGQNTCNQLPFKAINIINNPSFETNAASCSSGYLDQNGLVVPYWYTPTIGIRTVYFNSCSNFTISDSLVINEAQTDRFTILYPIVPQPIPDGNGVIAVSDIAYGGGMHVYPFHKSYVSACLQDALQKDS